MSGAVVLSDAEGCLPHHVLLRMRQPGSPYTLAHGAKPSQFAMATSAGWFSEATSPLTVCCLARAVRCKSDAVGKSAAAKTAVAAANANTVELR